MLDCRSLKSSVLLSIALLLAGIGAVFGTGLGWLPPVGGSLFGLVALAASLLVFAVTLFLSLLPGTGERLSNCSH